MDPKKRTTGNRSAKKPVISKRRIKRFPLLRSPLYNPRLNPPSIEAVRDYFKGKSIEEIVKDRNPLFSPFFLYSEYVVGEIYKMMKFPHRLNLFLLKKLFNRIVPLNPRNLEKTLFTTRLNCIVTPRIMNRKYPPWGGKHRMNLQREYNEWGKDVDGEKGKPISRNSFDRIFYDAKKEYELFKPILKGSTREEKLDDFLKMLQEFVDYHSGNDAPLTSLAVEIWNDACKGGKTVLK